MKYVYYSGCSMEGTAREYNESTRLVLETLGVELVDLEDWTCCGATAAESVNRMLSITLPARNLALAKRDHPGLDIVAPCSACYLNLKKSSEAVGSDGGLLRDVNRALDAEGLVLNESPRVRHLLDVLSTDVREDSVREKVTRPLKGLKIAPYYGCQCLRPYADFDDPETPVSMEPLLEAAGAGIHPWTVGAKCCGASHMSTKPEVGIKLVAAILEAAKGADAVTTVCPMCQMNLEAFQNRASKAVGRDLSVSILYLPQLLGLAFGFSWKQVRIDLNLAVSDSFHLG